MMSANITAASTPCRRTGCSVTSRAELRRVRDLPEGVPLADRAVLGQRAARLPHEPDRRALDRLAPRGPDEERLHPRSRLAGAVSKGPLAVPLGCAAVARAAGRRASSSCGSSSRTPARQPGGTSIFLAYHWLDDRDNPIVWDGMRTPLPPLAPGERTVATRTCGRRSRPARTGSRSTWSPSTAPGSRSSAAPMLTRRRRRAPRAQASRTPSLPPNVEPTRRLGASGCAPRTPRATASSRGAIEWAHGARRRRPRALAPYAPGPGRVPGFAAPLLCPSVLPGIELERLDDVGGPARVRSAARRAVGLRRPDRPPLKAGSVRARPRSGRRRA